MNRCPYCSQEYESQGKRDECVACHFSGEKKLPKPSKVRNKGLNILREFREDVST